MYAIQGCNKCIVNVSFLGPRDSVLFIEVSVFQGVRTALRVAIIHLQLHPLGLGPRLQYIIELL